ncbi:hypothetical protein C942_02313 [Photobacterium marinum]|uniref:Uncharacterized protein n=1 Tax=Photobacterium marinum TaxID=1056511 RepID=L8J6Z0_9GAMM|nr:hypothetical protein C942_02313 [Photobacterium marinum]
MIDLFEFIGEMPDERFSPCLLVFGMLGMAYVLTKSDSV